MTWHDALTGYRQWMQAGGRRPGTIRLRLHYLHALSQAHPEGPMHLTPADLIAWMASQHGWAPETRKSARAALCNFYRWAALMGHIQASPADALPHVLVPHTAPQPAPEDIIDSALARASQRDRLMLLLASRAGLRRGEIATLEWADITGTVLLVRQGKGGRQRVVPLSPMLRAELDDERGRRARGMLGTGWRYRVDPSSSWVFPAQAGGHMSPDTAGAVITRCLRVGTAHALQRRFATCAYAGTRDLRAVQELLGHSSPETTARYVAVGMDDLEAAVEAAA